MSEEQSKTESQPENEKNKESQSHWLSAPVLIALFSAIFGVLGTTLGVALQGFSSLRLERQKFEFSLIEQALKEDNALSVNEASRKEAARRLNFLIQSGIVESLDVKGIEKLLETPNDLPTFTASRTNEEFFCTFDEQDGTYQISFKGYSSDTAKKVFKFKKSNETLVYSPRPRCLLLAERLTLGRSSGKMMYLKIVEKNGYQTMCGTVSPPSPNNEQCDFSLISFSENIDINNFMKQVVDLNEGTQTEPIEIN